MKKLFSALGALFLRLFGGALDSEAKAPAAGKPPSPPSPPPAPEIIQSGDPTWLKRARADLGIREVPGPGANPQIMEAWRYVAYDPPDGDETAWCSAKACQWMEESGIPSTKAPNARSWEKWGTKLDKPKPGAVAVLWRGSPTSWQGHVALYIGPGRAGHVKLLGGNQGNSVSVAEYPASQVLSYRWPVTGSTSRTLKAQTAGMVGDTLTATGTVGAALDAPGIIGSLPDALAIGTAFQSLATYWPWFMVIGISISILARLVTIYARLSDFDLKGA